LLFFQGIISDGAALLRGNPWVLDNDTSKKNSGVPRCFRLFFAVLDGHRI